MEGKGDISVVLTLYKRPEMLLRQLEAVENQTIKPKEIFLFQDHISNGIYTIELEEEIKKRFTAIRICSENVGVGGRFVYANEVATCPYVAVFDDDTIPGKRWFENCMSHMEKKEAIYATIGVGLQQNADYPNKGFFRVGWGEPCDEAVEVDFGCHAWFVKREYLEPMAEENCVFRKKYTHVGEDAYLSFSNWKRNGISTIVPPHIVGQEEFWGSDVKTGLVVGQSSVAVSLNPNNLRSMTEMIKDYKADGWETLAFRKKEYFDELVEKMRNVGNNSQILM